MCTVVRGASCRNGAECGKGNWLRMSSAIVISKSLQVFNNSVCAIVRYHGQKIRNSVCCSWMYITKKRQNESVPIHRFPKENTGQRWIEACTNSHLSRLEYLQVVERQYFVYRRYFDEQYYYQKRNGAFLLKCVFFSQFCISSRNKNTNYRYF